MSNSIFLALIATAASDRAAIVKGAFEPVVTASSKIDAAHAAPEIKIATPVESVIAQAVKATATIVAINQMRLACRYGINENGPISAIAYGGSGAGTIGAGNRSGKVVVFA